MKHEEEEQQQQRLKTTQGLGLGQGFATVPRGVGPEQGLTQGPEQVLGLAPGQELPSAATQVPGLIDGSAPGLGPQSSGLSENDSGVGQIAGLVDGLEGSEEEWLRTLQAYLTFPDNNNNGMEPTMMEGDIGQFVGASWRSSGHQESEPEQVLAPELGLEAGIGLGTEAAQGLGLEPASEALVGLSIGELERLRTMERLLTLIGDPLGGQGLRTGLGLEAGTGTGLVTTTDAITTATPPDITTTSWLPKVPGF